MPEADKPAPAIVDLDDGGNFGRESVQLARPFKWRGATYTSIPLRVPTGMDIKKHTRSGRLDPMGLMCDLAELTEDVFDAMYAGDRNRVDVAVGKHLAISPEIATN